MSPWRKAELAKRERIYHLKEIDVPVSEVTCDDVRRKRSQLVSDRVGQNRTESVKCKWPGVANAVMGSVTDGGCGAR